MRQLKKVLSDQQLASVREALEAADFEDGRSTAGKGIQGIKNNLQLQRHSDEPMPLDQLIIGAINHHPVTREFVFPKRFTSPLYCKYEPGMKYGAHVDSPTMGGENPIRTDYSITLFLNEPDQYDGGELLIETPGGIQSAKLPAGDAVIYPTFELHQVAEVTRGERLVAVTWCQSAIRDPQLRQVVSDLNIAAAALSQSDPEAVTTRLVIKAANNLARLTVDP